MMKVGPQGEGTCLLLPGDANREQVRAQSSGLHEVSWGSGPWAAPERSPCYRQDWKVAESRLHPEGARQAG